MLKIRERNGTRGTKWRRKKKKWKNSDSSFSWSPQCSSPMAVLQPGVVHSSEKLLEKKERGGGVRFPTIFQRTHPVSSLYLFVCVRGSRDRRSKGRPEFRIKSFVARKF